MRKTLHIIIIIILQLLLSAPLQARTAPAEGPPKEFDVSYRISYQNQSRVPARIVMRIPVPATALPHQRVLSLGYSPVPVRMIKDNRGDTLEFHFNNVPPGKQAICRIDCTVENRRIIHLPDPGQIKANPKGKFRAYLEPEARFPCRNPVIIKTVAKIAGNEKNPYFKALKIYDYVRSLKYRLTSKSRPVLEILKTGQCQCRDAADLMITLLRAAGIPARFAGGIYLKELDTSTPDTHAWVEFYLEPYGWLPADPTMGRFSFFTRLSRFAEIDTPYLVLWRDQSAPFHIASSAEKNGGSGSAFKMEITFRAKQEREGVSIKSIEPGFSVKISKVQRKPDLPENAALRMKFTDAVNLLEKGDFVNSEKVFREVIRREKGFVSGYIHLYRASAGLKKENSLKSEMQALLKDKAARGPSLIVLGIIEAEQGRWEKALKHYSDARKSGIDSPRLDLLQGRLMLETRQLPAAAKMLNVALIKDPAILETYSGLYDLLTYLEDSDSIIDLSRLGIAVHNMPDFNYQLASASFRKKDYDTALKEVGIALEKVPGNPMLTGLLGQIMVKTGKKEEGIEMIKKAIKNLPADETDDLKEFLKYNS